MEKRDLEKRELHLRRIPCGVNLQSFVCVANLTIANGWAVGRNSLTLARMIICITFRDITFVEIICIILAFELRRFQMVQWLEKEHMEILLVLPIVFNRVIKGRIIYLVKTTWTSISSPTCGPFFLQSAPGGRYLTAQRRQKSRFGAGRQLGNIYLFTW